MSSEYFRDAALSGVAGPWLGLLLEWAVKGTLVLALTAVAALALRRAPAAWRHAVWTGAILSLPFLPLLSLVLPGWKVPPTEVPKQFYVALSFDPHRTKGIYLSCDKDIGESRSLTGAPDRGFKLVEDDYDWMVRPALVADPETEIPADPEPDETAAAPKPALDVPLPAEDASRVDRAGWLVERLKLNQFDAAPKLFNDALAKELPATELKRIWDEYERPKRAGPFEDPISVDEQEFPGGRLLAIRGRWEKAVMVIRLAFDDANRISGFWLARDKEGPTPKGFRRGGYMYGRAMEQIAGLDCSLTVRVAGLDGEPLEQARATLWRTQEGQSADDERLWQDRESGNAWKQFEGRTKGWKDRQFAWWRLSPGVYRVTARPGDAKAPFGMSEPIRLEEGGASDIVTVRLLEGATVIIRVIEGKTKKPLERPSVTLCRDDSLLPPDWRIWPRGNGQPFTLKHLPSGPYRVRVSQRARHPDGIEYAASDGPLTVDVQPGENEFTFELQGKPLSQDEIEKRWPWAVEGSVTDENGRPIEGVELWASCGMGTLQRTGRETSRANGTYALRFTPGMHMYAEGDKVPLNMQAATIHAGKPGLVEKNLGRQGGLCMANRMPKPEENYWKAEPDMIVLPGKPYRLDFVLVPGATVAGQLLDENGKPAVGNRVYLSGRELPPSSSVLCGTDTDEQGRFKFENVPTGYAWWFSARGEDRSEPKSLPATFPKAETYAVRLKLATEPLTNRGLVRIESVTAADNREIRDRVVGDDPMLRPPVSEELQAKAREILHKMAGVNRYWLVGPPEEVRGWRYDFAFAGEEPKTFEVNRNAGSSTSMRQGISYYGVLHYLTDARKEAVFRQVELGEETIKLTYFLKNPMRMSAGNGISGTWHGFFSRNVVEGTISIDAKTLTPREHVCERLREDFSEFVQVGDGHYVPLSIRIDKGMQFDWKFRVYKPGLWLLAEGRRAKGNDEYETVCSVDNVQVDGQPGEVASGEAQATD